jgi:hypothetical protein
MSLEKSDAKKKALKVAIKKELRPFMVELGFTPDKRPFEERDRVKIGLYVRSRDGYTDELNVLWRNYGRPLFMLEFWSSQVQRMQAAWERERYPYPATFDPNYMHRIYPRLGPRVSFFASEPWYGREKTVEQTIAVAKERLSELDSFLRTGAPKTHLDWMRKRA